MKSYDCEKRLIKVGNYAMTGVVLGKGHFARVQEATHIHLNVKVAVKVLTFREVKDEYIIKNMRREAKILAKVSHPNIIFLFETITTTKRYYIVTELVSGGDLCTYIMSQRTGKLDEKQTRPLARQIISAVSHLHERGIVHRDLKMENILLDEAKENVKLVDFGLSNYRRGAELLNTHCGSPEYAAPELYISGQQYGAEVDIWSLGVIFYGMLLGKLPFQSWQKPGLTAEAKRKQLIRETKIGLTQRHQRVLVEHSLLFRNLIEKMLCPDPNERITMLNLQSHAWIYGRFHRDYPSVDGAWKKLCMTRIAKMCDMSVSDVCRTIETKRYSPLAGIFNIAKLHELQRRIDAENERCGVKAALKKKPIQSQSTRPKTTTRAPKETTPAKSVLLRPVPPNVPLKPPNPILVRRSGRDLKQIKPNQKQTAKQKTPFTMTKAATPPRQGFTHGFGAAISRMLHKHKIAQNEKSPSECVQTKEFMSRVPRHTAARAIAKAEYRCCQTPSNGTKAVVFSGSRTENRAGSHKP